MVSLNMIHEHCRCRKRTILSMIGSAINSVLGECDNLAHALYVLTCCDLQVRAWGSVWSWFLKICLRAAGRGGRIAGATVALRAGAFPSAYASPCACIVRASASPGAACRALGVHLGRRARTNNGVT